MTDEKSPYVLVSVFREDAKEQDVIQAANKIATIIDEWNMQGNMIWSGSFDDDKTSMSVIEGTKPEIDAFFRKYDDVCKSFLSSYTVSYTHLTLPTILLV